MNIDSVTVAPVGATIAKVGIEAPDPVIVNAGFAPKRAGPQSNTRLPATATAAVSRVKVAQPENTTPAGIDTLGNVCTKAP